jgi:NhaP-type Na+/H+ or K+/H+ antiporter
MMAFLVCFFLAENIIHKYHPAIGHHTGVIIVIGIVFSFSYYKGHGETPTDFEQWQFRPNVFFNMILPPIVFNSGYNMRQRKFFENLGNVMVMGIGVTFVCFFIYSASTYYVVKYLDLTMTRYTNDLTPDEPMKETLPIDMPFMSLLMFTSLVCSSDVVAAVSIVDFHAAPKLYSCIFGEGITNDIVSIVLFNTVKGLQGKAFTSATSFIIIA